MYNYFNIDRNNVIIVPRRCTKMKKHVKRERGGRLQSEFVR